LTSKSPYFLGNRIVQKLRLQKGCALAAEAVVELWMLLMNCFTATQSKTGLLRNRLTALQRRGEGGLQFQPLAVVNVAVEQRSTGNGRLAKLSLRRG
jgi:hypothetical protein